MTDKIGVLGSSTNTAVGTYTAYTCPASKAAKLKLQMVGQANAGAVTSFEIQVNGASVFKSGNITAGNYIWSSTQALSKNNASYPNGQALADTVAPAPAEYYLSAGQTVTIIIGGNNSQSCNLQVVGSEIDV